MTYLNISFQIAEIQNAAARVVSKTRKYEYINPVLSYGSWFSAGYNTN